MLVRFPRPPATVLLLQFYHFPAYHAKRGNTFEPHRFLSVRQRTADDQANPTSAISQFTRSKSLGEKKNLETLKTQHFQEPLRGANQI